MMTLSLDWPKDSSELKDEPIIVECQLGAFKWGDLLGRSFQPFERGYSTIRQAVGSLDIQLFLRRFFDRNDPMRSGSKDRARSSSNSRSRFPEAPKVVSATKSGNIFSGNNNHPDFLNVPDYYKVDILRKVVPLSLTASPGIFSLSISSGTTSLTSTSGFFSSLSTSSARSPGSREPKLKEEIELCQLFTTGNCIRGLLCSYRHEPQEKGLSKPYGRKG